MSILFDQTIIHFLDLAQGIPVLSSKPIVLNDEIEAYITKYLTDLFDSHNMCQAIFEETSPWGQIFRTDSLDFYSFSCDLAKQFYAYMQTLQTIPSGDLVFTKFERDELPYLAFFKLNYKEAYTHVVDQAVAGPVNQIIKHHTIFPDTISKIQEAALIRLDTCDVLLLDGHKEKYLHTLLGTTCPLSTKEKIKVIEKVITETIEENFENKLEAISFAKTNLAKSIDHTSSILIEEVLEETFKDHDQLKEACLNTFHEEGITEKAIEITHAEKVGRKYTSHKLKTNTGIELKLPTEMLHDPNKIEFINNPDGTLSIVLKNIGSLMSK